VPVHAFRHKQTIQHIYLIQVGSVATSCNTITTILALGFFITNFREEMPHYTSTTCMNRHFNRTRHVIFQHQNQSTLLASSIDTHYKLYRVSGIDTFGIVLPNTSSC